MFSPSLCSEGRSICILFFSAVCCRCIINLHLKTVPFAVQGGSPSYGNSIVLCKKIMFWQWHGMAWHRSSSEFTPLAIWCAEVSIWAFDLCIYFGTKVLLEYQQTTISSSRLVVNSHLNFNFFYLLSKFLKFYNEPSKLIFN